MRIRITGTPEEAIRLVQQLREILRDIQVSSFEPRGDGSRLGNVVVVTPPYEEETTGE